VADLRDLEKLCQYLRLGEVRAKAELIQASGDKNGEEILRDYLYCGPINKPGTNYTGSWRVGETEKEGIYT
jgi:hypothetical protein